MLTAIVDANPGEAVEAAGAKARWLAGVRVACVGSSTPLKIASGALRDFGARIDNFTAPTDEKSLHTAGYDIVLVDRIESMLPIASSDGAGVHDYLQFVERTNSSVWVTASAYGLQTSRADGFGSELVALASGGVLGHSRRGADAIPVVPAGDIALKLVGITMAMSALYGLNHFRETNSPVHLDLSAQSAVIASGLCLEMGHALGRCADEGGSSRYGAPTGFFECRDGQVYVVVLEQHQWEALRTCLEPALRDIPTIEDARRLSAEVNAAMASWASQRSNTECERTLQDVGVPCNAVNPVGTFIERARDAGRMLSTGDGVPTLPGVVAQNQREGQDKAAEGYIPLRALRVLDAGHVLAVPLATAWLGAMGAQVTKLEDPGRLDVYRRRGPFVEGEKGLNRGAYFNQVNYCKKSLDIQVGPNGSLLDIQPYDVIVHNLSPRRARALGVDGASVLDSAGPKLSVGSSGFGATGEWSNYRAYGHNIHAFAGLVAATRDADGNMGDVGTPWADPLTGAVIATWVLAWSLAKNRVGNVAVDLSMAEIMAAQLIDLKDTDPESYYQSVGVGGEFFLRAEPDGGTVAVTLRTSEDVARFEKLTGVTFDRPASLGAMLPHSALGSLAHLDSGRLADKLRESGLAAAAVQTARDLASDEFLRSTGLFQQVTSATLGSYEVTGLPWVAVGQPRAHLTGAPERPSAEK